MNKKTHKDLYMGIFLFVFGLVYYFFLIPNSITSKDSLTTLGPGFFPKLTAILLIVLSVFLIIKSLIQLKKGSDDLDDSDQEEDTGKGQSRPWAGAGVFLLMVLYVFIVEYLGFMVTTVIVMLAIMAVLSVRKWYSYVVMILVIFGIKFVFEDLMYIILP
jgi:putative tricarboxylic transport membrane protein